MIKLSKEWQAIALSHARSEESANPDLCGPDGKMSICQLFENDLLTEATDEHGNDIDEDVNLDEIDFGFLNRRFV